MMTSVPETLTALGVIVGTVVLLFLLKLWRLQKTWKDAGIPHESYLSYLHSVFVRYRRENVFDVLHDYRARFGDVYGTYHGLSPMLRVSRLEVARDVLIRQFSRIHSRSIDIKTGVPLWDGSLIAKPYSEWKQLRQATGAGLTAQKLRSITPKLQSLGSRFADRLTESAAKDSGRVFPYEATVAFALDCVGAVVFGVDLDSQADGGNRFVQQSRNIMTSPVGFSLFTTLPSLIRYVPFISFPDKAAAKFFQDFAFFAIDQRRKANSEIEESSLVDQDLLDVWLREQRANPAFSDEVIASQMFFFVLAGSDTTAYTLNLVMYFLATHPDEQDKAYEEILTHETSTKSDSETSSTTHNDDPQQPSGVARSSLQDFTRLKFVQACILETLRLCPTDYVLDRICDEPCNVAGVQLAQGTHIQIPVPVVQRNPAIFEEPDLFKPDRFLDESTQAMDAFLAFGDGPKNCIGRRVALLEVTVALVAVLKKLRLGRCAETPEKLTFYEGMPFLPFPKQPTIIALGERIRADIEP